MSEYRTIVAGSRSITDRDLVFNHIDNVLWTITTIISGCADGVDQLGEQYADQHGIPVEQYPVHQYDSESGGMPTPLYRNVQMAKNADAVIAIWDGESSGTEHMIRTATDHGLEVSVTRTDTHSFSEFEDGH